MSKYRSETQAFENIMNVDLGQEMIEKIVLENIGQIPTVVETDAPHSMEFELNLMPSNMNSD